MRCHQCRSLTVQRAEGLGADSLQCTTCGGVSRAAEKVAEYELSQKELAFMEYLNQWPRDRIDNGTPWPALSEELTQIGLSRHLGIARSNVSRLADSLLSAGLISRKKAYILDENNRARQVKKWVYFLTRAGVSRLLPDTRMSWDAEEKKRRKPTNLRALRRQRKLKGLGLKNAGVETFGAEPFICPECQRESTKSKNSQVCVRCESEYQAGRNLPMNVPWPNGVDYYAEKKNGMELILADGGWEGSNVLSGDEDAIKYVIKQTAFMEEYRPDLGMLEDWDMGGDKWLDQWFEDNDLETIAQETGWNITRVSSNAVFSGNKEGIIVADETWWGAESFEANWFSNLFGKKSSEMDWELLEDVDVHSVSQRAGGLRVWEAVYFACIAEGLTPIQAEQVANSKFIRKTDPSLIVPALTKSIRPFVKKWLMNTDAWDTVPKTKSAETAETFNAEFDYPLKVKNYSVTVYRNEVGKDWTSGDSIGQFDSDNSLLSRRLVAGDELELLDILNELIQMNVEGNVPIYNKSNFEFYLPSPEGDASFIQAEVLAIWDDKEGIYMAPNEYDLEQWRNGNQQIYTLNFIFDVDDREYFKTEAISPGLPERNPLNPGRPSDSWPTPGRRPTRRPFRKPNRRSR